MADILYLVHRLPFPPNKGDKVRSFHLLKHLASRHRVFLGTFVDDPDDYRHVDTVRAMCTDLYVADLSPLKGRLRSLAGLASGEALTLPYYSDGGLRRWVGATVRSQDIHAAVVFSSAMAQYVEDMPDVRMLVDLVDVDSAKWTEYADRHRWPMSWLYRREGRRLLAFERRVVARSARSFFVTPAETRMFAELAPECEGRIDAMCNGVDADFFEPESARQSPFPAGEKAVVFTGAMDYWPNVDGVTWFVTSVLPHLRLLGVPMRFYIVGRAPAAAVLALAGTDVVVTGTVADVRPYLQYAAVIVAPLRVARGIQNKILEAMAMGKAVVASEACAAALDALRDRDYLAAGTAEEFAGRVGELLNAPERAATIGTAAREAVLAQYSWTAHLRGIDAYLDDENLPRAAMGQA